MVTWGAARRRLLPFSTPLSYRVRTQIQSDLYDEYHELLAQRHPAAAEAYPVEALREDAAMAVLLMWMYAVCVSLPILAHHATQKSHRGGVDGGGGFANAAVDSSSNQHGEDGERNSGSGGGGASEVDVLFGTTATGRLAESLSQPTTPLRQRGGGVGGVGGGGAGKRSGGGDADPLERLRQMILTLKVAMREHGCPALVERLAAEVEASGSFYFDHAAE